jgi:hypothetical protein
METAHLPEAKMWAWKAPAKTAPQRRGNVQERDPGGLSALVAALLFVSSTSLVALLERIILSNAHALHRPGRRNPDPEAIRPNDQQNAMMVRIVDFVRIADQTLKKGCVRCPGHPPAKLRPWEGDVVHPKILA